MTAKAITYNGITFPSMSAFADHIGENASDVRAVLFEYDYDANKTAAYFEGLKNKSFTGEALAF